MPGPPLKEPFAALTRKTIAGPMKNYQKTVIPLIERAAGKTRRGFRLSLTLPARVGVPNL